MKAIPEVSYGIIPTRIKDDQRQVLLIQHQKGHYWAFPKGHAEEGEQPLETAKRELFEETGLSVQKVFDAEVITESYEFFREKNLISKTVHYFIAEVIGEVVLQQEELEDYLWIPLDKAESQVTFPQARSVCQKMCNFFQ